MKKDVKVLGMLLTLLLLVGVLHGGYHFFVYGTGISGFVETGISGFQIGDLNLKDELVALSPQNLASSTSTWILVVEWLVVLVVGTILVLRRRAATKREMAALNLLRAKVKKTGTTTELDNLYEVLKDKKHLKLSTISRVYGVDKEVVLSWGRTLESGHLIHVDYPLFGEPKFTYSENMPDTSKKKKKE